MGKELEGECTYSTCINQIINHKSLAGSLRGRPRIKKMVMRKSVGLPVSARCGEKQKAVRRNSGYFGGSVVSLGYGWREVSTNKYKHSKTD